MNLPQVSLSDDVKAELEREVMLDELQGINLSESKSL